MRGVSRGPVPERQVWKDEELAGSAGESRVCGGPEGRHRGRVAGAGSVDRRPSYACRKTRECQPVTALCLVETTGDHEDFTGSSWIAPAVLRSLGLKWGHGDTGDCAGDQSPG